MLHLSNSKPMTVNKGSPEKSRHIKTRRGKENLPPVHCPPAPTRSTVVKSSLLSPLQGCPLSTFATASPHQEGSYSRNTGPTYDEVLRVLTRGEYAALDDLDHTFAEYSPDPELVESGFFQWDFSPTRQAASRPSCEPQPSTCSGFNTPMYLLRDVHKLARTSGLPPLTIRQIDQANTELRRPALDSPHGSFYYDPASTQFTLIENRSLPSTSQMDDPALHNEKFRSKHAVLLFKEHPNSSTFGGEPWFGLVGEVYLFHTYNFMEKREWLNVDNSTREALVNRYVESEELPRGLMLAPHLRHTQKQVTEWYAQGRAIPLVLFRQTPSSTGEYIRIPPLSSLDDASFLDLDEEFEQDLLHRDSQRTMLLSIAIPEAKAYDETDRFSAGSFASSLVHSINRLRYEGGGIMPWKLNGLFRRLGLCKDEEELTEDYDVFSYFSEHGLGMGPGPAMKENTF